MTEISILNLADVGRRRKASGWRRATSPRTWSTEQVLRAALDIPDWVRSGDPDMSVLARQLGIPVVALYAKFGGSQRLVEALAQQAEAKLYDQHVHRDGLSLEVELRAHYHEVRASLHRRPHLADLLFCRGQAVPASMQGFEATNPHVKRHVDAMIGAGIEPGLAVGCFSAITAFTVAFVIQTERAERMGAYHHDLEVFAGANHWFACGADPVDTIDVDEQFEITLELMLRGLRTMTRDTTRQPESPETCKRPSRDSCPPPGGGPNGPRPTT
jgi:AcrR family transcriptional regulator